MNIPFFNPRKINKDSSTSILRGIQSLMPLGYSILQSLYIQRDIEEGKNKKVIEQAVNLVSKKNVDLEKALLQVGLISEEEKMILTYSKDTKVSIDYIVELRDLSKNFNKTFLRLVFFPILALYIGVLVVNTILPIMRKPIDELLEIIKISKGVDMSNSLNIPSIFFFVENPDLFNLIMIIFTIVLILSFVAFFYYEKNDPSKIYRIFPLKAYDDIPYVFTLMRSLNVSGKDFYTISKDLSKSKINKGWRKLFSNIQKKIENNTPFFQSFKEFNIPKQIYIIVKISEASKALWDNLERTIVYAKKVNVDANADIIRKYGSLSTILSYIIIIYFLIGVLFLMLNIQTIASLMN